MMKRESVVFSSILVSTCALAFAATSVSICAPAARADVRADETRWTKLIDDALRYETLGQLDNAEAYYLQAVAEARRIDGDGPHLIRTLCNLANLYERMKKMTEAEDCLKEAQKVATAMPGREGKSWQVSVLGDLADYYALQKKPVDRAEAQAEVKKIDATIEKDLTDFSSGFSRLQYSIRKNWHPPKNKVTLLVTVDWQTEKDGHFELVHTHQSCGDEMMDEAAIAAVMALSGASALPPSTLGPVEMRMDFAYNAWNKDGTQVPATYAKKADSIENSIKIVDDAEAASGPDSPNLIALLCSLGHSYESVNRYTDAERVYERSLKIYDKNNLKDRVVLANIYCLLGHIQVLTNDFDKADKSFKSALRVTEDELNPSIVNARAQVMAEYKSLLFRQGKRKEARELH